MITKQLSGTAIDLTDFKPESILDAYDAQRRTKQEMKEQVAQFAADIWKAKQKPLVFIIDELDRCRPTFAIELLERVKHIFDVPNIVFVFGINRAQLTKSLRSVYGEIDADEYLRRFFDMEFILPEADAKEFCDHLVQRYGLRRYSSEMSDRTGNRIYWDEFKSVASSLALIVGHLGLSLRDTDYCVRLLALAARGGQPYATGLPSLFVLLVAAKISNPALYHRVVHGNGRGAELLDYMDERHGALGGQAPHAGSRDSSTLTMLEAAVYAADDGPASLDQLEQLKGHAEPNRPEYLTKATASLQIGIEAHASRLNTLAASLERLNNEASWEPFSLASVARSVELTSDITMR